MKFIFCGSARAVLDSSSSCKAPPRKPRTQSSVPAKNNSYRPEIDGLRAIAVVAVIINHFNPEVLPGGYLGVDIFFVISGFVITSSLSRRNYTSLNSLLASFFKRRIKRLAPALLLFILVTSVLISLFNPIPRDSIRTAFSSVFGLSNLYLLHRSSDYFGTSSSVNAFTHTWSLAVEEQFYLLFPFLIWFTGFTRNPTKGHARLAASILFLTILSFSLYVYLSSVNQIAAYYLMPSRLWEISAGCLLFLVGKYIRQIRYFDLPISFIALIAMMALMIAPLQSNILSTLFSVVLTCIVIFTCSTTTHTYGVLTSKPMLLIGTLSYSLYLWHWGILVVSRWTVGIQWWTIPFQVFFILLASLLSYHLLEKPIREGRYNYLEFCFSNPSFLLFSAFAVAGWLLILDFPLKTHLYTAKNKQYHAVPDHNLRLSNKYCEKHNLSLKTTLCNSPSGSIELPVLWLVGDSHASRLIQTYRSLANSYNYRLKTFAAGATPFPPLGHYRKNEKLKDLAKLNDFHLLQDFIEKEAKSGDIVTVALRQPFHFGGTYYDYPADQFVFFDADGNHVSQKRFYDLWKSAMESFSARMDSKGVHIILFTPTPEWSGSVSELNLSCQAYMDPWFSQLQPRHCTKERDFFTDPRRGLYNHLFNGMRKIANSHRNVHLVDAFSLVCPDPICYYGTDSETFYIDGDHLSLSFAEEALGPSIASVLDSLAAAN